MFTFSSSPQATRTDALALPIDHDELQQITDPWRRSQLADALAKHLGHVAAAVLQIRDGAVRELVSEHRTPQAHVARHLGVSKTRINQVITRARLTETVAA